MDINVAGIIFDKDGTLFDFDKTWNAITQQIMIAECAHNPESIEKLSKILGFDLEHKCFQTDSPVIAASLAQIAKLILPFTHDQNYTALMNRMAQIGATAQQVQAADLKTLLADLVTRGFKLGVATNDAEQPARANLSQAGIIDSFDFIAGFDSGFGAKPAPGQLLAFCKHVNLKPNQCVMVGDSRHDLDAGRQAGMRTIGVLTGLASRDDLSPYADIVMKTIADIPPWLDQDNST